MKNAERIQLHVVDELAYDASVDSSRITVTATEDGVVTLRGSVPTYMQARAAERAAKRVRGVLAVASDIDVHPSVMVAGDDTTIAETALRALGASASVPKEAVRVTVTDGWVTLEGDVGFDFQRRAAETSVRDLHGVRGVTNRIEIRPPVKPLSVKTAIESAFRRNAQLDAEQVTVSASGGTVTLRGTVSSWAEKDAAERAAFAAPGVTSVKNLLEVRHHAPVF
jgi:osmotically-inducible protein OsmY